MAASGRFLPKQVPTDVWSLKEKLALASSVKRSGDNNWVSVARSIRPNVDLDRPVDWFSQRNCALQYSDLLEKVETPKRKRGEREVMATETPGDIIVRKLTIERIEELKTIVQEEQKKYKKLRQDVEKILLGQSDDQMDEIQEEIDREKKAKEEMEKKLMEEMNAREAKLRQRKLGQGLKIKEDVDEPKESPGDAMFLEEDSNMSLPSESTPQSTSSQDIKPPVSTTEQLGAEQLAAAVKEEHDLIAAGDIKLEPVEVDVSTTEVAIKEEPRESGDGHEHRFKLDEQAEQTGKCNIISAEKIDKDSLKDVQTDRMNNLDAKSLPENESERDKRKKSVLEKDSEREVELVKECSKSSNDTEKLSKKESRRDLDGSVKIKGPEKETKKGPIKSPENESKTDSMVSGASMTEVLPILSKLLLRPTPDMSHTPQKFTGRTRFSGKTTSVTINTLDIPACNITSVTLSPKKSPSSLSTAVSMDFTPKLKMTPTKCSLKGLSPVKTLHAKPAHGRLFMLNASEDNSSTLDNFPIAQDSRKDLIDKEREIFVQVIDDKDEKDSEMLDSASEGPGKDFDDAPLSPSSSIMSNDTDGGSMMAARGKGRRSRGGKSKGGRRSLRRSGRNIVEEDKAKESETSSKAESSDDEGIDTTLQESDDTASNATGRQQLSFTESVPNSPASIAPGDSDDEKAFKVWKKSIMLVWRAAANHKYTNVFSHPVREEIAPGYRSIVYRPLDLATIKKYIETGAIRTTAEFQRDMMQMFTNAIMYNNSDHDVFHMATDMYDDVMRHIEQYVHTQIMVQGGESKLLRPSRRSEAHSDKEDDPKRKRLISDQDGGKSKKRKT